MELHQLIFRNSQWNNNNSVKCLSRFHFPQQQRLSILLSRFMSLLYRVSRIHIHKEFNNQVSSNFHSNIRTFTRYTFQLEQFQVAQFQPVLFQPILLPVTREPMEITSREMDTYSGHMNQQCFLRIDMDRVPPWPIRRQATMPTRCSLTM